MTSIIEEYNSEAWKSMPKNQLLKLQNPAYGMGTVSSAYWTFCDLVPTLTETTRGAGGKLRMEDGGVVRFGNPASKFIHKIYYSSRR